MRDFLVEWHEGARTELALTAWTNYGQIIRRNINPYLGSKRLTDLSALDVKRCHGKLLESGRRDGEALSVAPVKLAHRILRRALADAVRWNLIVTNPAAATRVPKGEAKELTVWSADEARRFLAGVADDRLVGLWTLALHTGRRSSNGAVAMPQCFVTADKKLTKFLAAEQAADPAVVIVRGYLLDVDRLASDLIASLPQIEESITHVARRSSRSARTAPSAFSCCLWPPRSERWESDQSIRAEVARCRAGLAIRHRAHDPVVRLWSWLG